MYAAGDGGMAKTLSNEGKEHNARMEELNLEASAWIYASKSHCQMIRRICHPYLAFREQ